MSRKPKKYAEIEKLKNTFMDSAVLLGTVLGFVAFFMSLINAVENGIKLNHLNDLFVLVIFSLVFVFRKKIRLEIKTIFIIIGLFLLFLSDFIMYGVYSDNIVLIIVLLFISFLVFRLKAAIWLFVLFSVTFAVLAYFHLTEVLGKDIAHLDRFLGIDRWIIKFLLITIAIFAILLILREFNKGFLSLIDDLEEKNKYILEKESNYTQIFNATSDAIFIHDTAGKIIEVNESMLKMYKYKKEEISSLDINDFSEGLKPYAGEDAARFVQEAIEKGQKVFDWRAKDKEGKVFWAEVTLKTVKIGGDDRVLALVKDIDEQKKTAIEIEDYKNKLELKVKKRTEELETINEELNCNNEELLKLNDNIKDQKNIIEEKERRLNSIIYNQGEGLGIVDLNENFILATPATHQIFGLSDGELIGRNLNEFIKGKSWDEIIRQTEKRKNNIRSSYDVTLILENGQRKHIILTGSPDYDEEGKVRGTIANFNDITDRILKEKKLKELNEDIEASNKELNEANEELLAQKDELQITIETLRETQKQLFQSEKMASLGELAAGVAHEINNPLNFIKGGISALELVCKDYFDSKKKDVKPLVNAINEGVKRASSIVTGLNHYSRQGDSYGENCDIHSIIENCLTILHTKFKTGIEIIKEYQDSSVKIKGNEGKLYQIFLNVLSNAEQSINEKGKIVISTQNNGNYIIISVIDNGSGIKEENLQKIADPFFTTKDPGQGTGLGLSIVHRIIKEHNGLIEFKSEIDKGTTVIIKLPIE